MTYVGGLRARLLRDSFYNFLYDAVDELGWFATEGRQHNYPVSMVPEPLEWDDEALPNLVTISEEAVDEEELELGSGLTEFTWHFYIDVYAESLPVGLHLATDIRDVLSGRFTSLTTNVGPMFPVIDLTVDSATPVELFNVDINEVEMERVRRDAPKAFQKYWWVVYARVQDSYWSEDDDA